MFFVPAGASPYSMGPASQGTPTPMMSPAPPSGPQDSMGYNMNLNGSDYSSPSMPPSQVGIDFYTDIHFFGFWT
jgi:pre-B-cell leukemia transcription factor 1